jgi:hypothetical protein
LTIARIIIAAFIWLLAASGARAIAQTAPPSASPSPSPAASSGPSDPCGSLLSTVNRPTVTTGVCTVRTGYADLENGYTNTVTNGPGGGVTATYPQSLLRIGTFDPHLDFEFNPPSVSHSSVGGTIATGAADIGFGAKYELGYTAQALWGVNASMTIPTGTRAFSAGNAQYTGNFNWLYQLSPVFAVSGTMGFNALSGYNASGTAQSYFAFVPSLEVSAGLPGPSSAYAEYAYFSHAGPGLGAKSQIDVGYSIDFGQHVQLDVEYGFFPTSLNGQTQHYVGAGLSFMN